MTRTGRGQHVELVKRRNGRSFIQDDEQRALEAPPFDPSPMEGLLDQLVGDGAEHRSESTLIMSWCTQIEASRRGQQVVEVDGLAEDLPAERRKDRLQGRRHGRPLALVTVEGCIEPSKSLELAGVFEHSSRL